MSMCSGRIVLVLPGSMPFRMVVGSGLLDILCEKTDRSIVVVCPDEKYRNKLPQGVEWRELRNPGFSSKQPLYTRIARSALLRVEALLNITFQGLAYRLNEISGFQAHQFKKEMSGARQTREELAGNFVRKRHGFPWASSRYLYRIYRAIYYRRAYIPDHFIRGLFEETPIDLIVFWHAQNEVYRDYVHCARIRSIPMVAAIGSWDRASTKGPLMPGVVSVISINQVMKEELIKFHAIPSDVIEVVGWPQMDNYYARNPEKQLAYKEKFLSRHGFKENTKIIVYAGNAERLGLHEPGLVEHLAERVESELFGRDICFFLRPHPQDLKFKERFAMQLKKDKVHWEDASLTNLSQLKDLFLSADIVISTQGSVSLDAVAVDCCVINVAFDGDLHLAYDESVERSYEMDHYQPVVKSGGVVVVRNYEQLDKAVEAYIKDIDLHASGREKLRHNMLEPLDGLAVERIVGLLLSELITG